MINPDCPICLGLGWVCGNHPKRVWGETGCESGAGMPCECQRGLKQPDASQVIHRADQTVTLLSWDLKDSAKGGFVRMSLDRSELTLDRSRHRFSMPLGLLHFHCGVALADTEFPR